MTVAHRARAVCRLHEHSACGIGGLEVYLYTDRESYDAHHWCGWEQQFCTVTDGTCIRLQTLGYNQGLGQSIYSVVLGSMLTHSLYRQQLLPFEAGGVVVALLIVRGFVDFAASNLGLGNLA